MPFFSLRRLPGNGVDAARPDLSTPSRLPSSVNVTLRTFFVDAATTTRDSVFPAHWLANGVTQVMVGPSTTVSFFCRNAVFGRISSPGVLMFFVS